MRATILAVAISLGLTPAALAANSGGAGFTYNPGTHGVGLNVKNSPESGSPLTGADITLPQRTQLNGTPTGGPACTTTPPQEASCVFSPAVPAGDQAFVLVNTTGAKPASIDVTLDFEDGSSVDVVATECTAITVLPDVLPVATGRAPYSVDFDATGGAGDAYTFAHQGALPAGLTFDESGTLNGAPTQTGTFNFTVLAFDGRGCQGSRNYTLTVQPESAGPPQTTDVEIVSIKLGIFFQEQESGPLFSVFFVPVAPFEGPSKGFHEFPAWFAGDRAQIQVEVRNNGPSAATFNLNVSPLSGRELEYNGYYAFEQGLGDILPVPVFKAGLPPVLAPGQTVFLLFTTKLPGPGPVTLSASLTDVSPTDSNPANNSAGKTIAVQGRVRHRDVSWKPDGAGGDITGTSSPASGSARAAVAAAARLRPVEIAVVRRRRGRCTWLTGRKGRLQRKATASRCLKPVFLRARGTRRWRYHLDKRPPTGRYTVLVRRRPPSRARAEQQFARSLGNLFRIRIRN
jgi:hypothetical protein